MSFATSTSSGLPTHPRTRGGPLVLHWLARAAEALSALPEPHKRGVLLSAIALGVVAMAYYYSWWLDLAHRTNLLLAPLLLLAIVYNITQVLAAWCIYLRVRRPAARVARPGLSVDVFVPVYDENPSLVARSLAAAVAMTYPHRTFLLDDAHSHAFRALADRLGAVYIRRTDHAHAKAGNVNHALALSDAEFVTVFDVDHIPEPHFLDAVLGLLPSHRC